MVAFCYHHTSVHDGSCTGSVSISLPVMSLILSVAVCRGLLVLLNNQLHRRGDVIFLVKYSHRGQF